MEREMELIRKLFYDAIAKQLNTPYPSMSYFGQRKRGNSPRKASGKLLRSLEVKWEEDFNADPNAPEPLLVAELDDYYWYIDQGRRPSLQYPPLDAIKKWVKAKPIYFRNSKGRFTKGTDDQKTFLIARSIKERGFKGINFLTKAENEVMEQLQELGENAALAFFEEVINKGLVTAKAKQ